MKIKVLFVCDYRSIHARRFIESFRRQYDTYIVTIHYYQNDFDKDHFFYMKKSNSFGKSNLSNLIKFFVKTKTWKFVQKIHLKIQILLEIFFIRFLLLNTIYKINPNVIHALRAQPEGIALSKYSKDFKFFLSTWGQDFIFFKNDWLFTKLNKVTLSRTSYLLVDTLRDRYYANFLGLPNKSKIKVLNCATIGLDLSEFIMTYNSFDRNIRKKRIFKEEDVKVILSCRGFGKSYIDNDALIQIMSKLIQKGVNNVRLVLDGKMNTPGFYHISKIINNYKLEKYCIMVNYDHQKLLTAMKTFDIYISPSITDGTPISMLEAMANGMYPVVSNIINFQDLNEELEIDIIDFNDINDAESKLLNVLMNEITLKNKIERNFELLKNKFDITTNVSMIENMYIE